jgi:hypothetical protein
VGVLAADGEGLGVDADLAGVLDPPVTHWPSRGPSGLTTGGSPSERSGWNRAIGDSIPRAWWGRLVL